MLAMTDHTNRLPTQYYNLSLLLISQVNVNSLSCHSAKQIGKFITFMVTKTTLIIIIQLGNILNLLLVSLTKQLSLYLQMFNLVKKTFAKSSGSILPKECG